MPQLLGPQAGLQVEPWMLAAWWLSSGAFLFYALPEPHQQRAATVATRVWSESSPAAVEEAKQLSEQVLDVVLQSQLSTFFLAQLVFSFGAIAAWVTKFLFLGRLSVTETSKLTERLMMFVLLKIVFFGAVVNPTKRDVGTWLTWFLAMGYLKMFVGLAGDRCEALLSSPSSTPLQHLRCLALLLGILVNMVSWMADHVALLGDDRAKLSSAALWLFDGATVVVEASHGIVKYGVHALERWRALRAEKQGEDGAGPWEWQGSFLYHLELGADLTLHTLTLGHYCHLWFCHGLRFQLIDMVLAFDIRHVALVIWRRVGGFRRYRRLTAAVRDSFPDASAEQLAGGECAICMERMKSAKVLPCRHTFHISCLRAWLQQSRGGAFSCPLCRASLLVEDLQPDPHHHHHHLQQHQEEEEEQGQLAGHGFGAQLGAGSEAARAELAQQGGRSGASGLAAEPVSAFLALMAAVHSAPQSPAASLVGGRGRGRGHAGPAGAIEGGTAGRSTGAGSRPAPDQRFWAELDDIPPPSWHGAAVGGGPATGPAGGLAGGLARGGSSLGRASSLVTHHPLGSAARHARFRPAADLEDTAAGPSCRPLLPSASTGGSDGRDLGAAAAEAGSDEPGADFAAPATLAGALAAQSLRTMSRAVSHLSRSISQRQGEPEEGGEGEVNQPIPAHRPAVHRYNTRSRSAAPG